MKLSSVSVPLSVVAVVLASLAAHSRLVTQQRPRTMLSGNVFEDTRLKTGNRMKLVGTVTDSRGQEVCLMDTVFRKGHPGAIPGWSASPPLHTHTYQTECFKTKSGVLGYIVNGLEGRLGPNEELCVPPHAVHTVWNAQNETDLAAEVTLQPPGNAAAFFRTVYGLGLDWGGLGNVSPFQILATFVAGGVTLADVPKPAWWAIEHVLVPGFIQPVMGVQALPPEYTGQVN